jgi:hypothetical protein
LVLGKADFWMSVIDISKHQVIVISFFFVDTASPILAIAQDSENGLLFGIFILLLSESKMKTTNPIGSCKMMPMPLHIGVLVFPSRKRKTQPTSNLNGISDSLCTIYHEQIGF